MIGWIPNSTTNENGESIYSLIELYAKFEAVRLCQDGWMFLNWDEKRFWLKFAVLQFYSSDADGNSVQLECVFHGEGPTGGLRECRHTWWGEGGYIFYPKGKIITSAISELAKHFDDLN
jgi:hypothetical protein